MAYASINSNKVRDVISKYVDVDYLKEYSWYFQEQSYSYYPAATDQ